MEVCRMNEYGREVAKKMESYMGNTDSVAEEISDIQNAQKGVEVRGALAAGVKKAFDKSETSESRSIEAYNITQDLLDDSFDTSIINQNFEQRLNEKIDNLQPNWTAFQKETTTKLTKITDNINSFYINVVTEGFIGDGTEEDTTLLNDIIRKAHERGGGTVFFPSRIMPYLIRVQIGIINQSNVRLLADKGAKIKATPTGNSSYSLIHCENIENFSIEGFNLIGERYEHSGDSGQWGHGINLLGCSGFVIKDVKISECWGDGIYVGPSTEKAFCENGLIDNSYCDDNRRNGISITSAKDLRIIAPKAFNTDGHDPRAGIDIEPNSTTDVLQDIVIKRAFTAKNGEYGIIFSPGKLVGSGKPVSVTITEHKDIGSKIGFGVIKCTGPLEGFVKNIDFDYTDNKDKAVFIRDYHSVGPEILLRVKNIENPFTNQEGKYESNKYGGVISILRDLGDSNNGKIGNVKIINPSIHDPLNKAYSDISIFDEISQIENISIIDPVYLEHEEIRVNTTDLITIEDKNRLLVFHLDKNVSNTLPSNLRYAYIDNKGVAEYGGGSRTINLIRPLANGTEITIEVVENHQIIVDFNSNVTVKPFQTSYSSFKSNQIGSKVTIQKIGDTVWVVKNIIGFWEGLNA